MLRRVMQKKVRGSQKIAKNLAGRAEREAENAKD